jgi:anthranilate synthase
LSIQLETGNSQYITSSGISIFRSVEECDSKDAVNTLLTSINENKGVLFSSSYEYPGRYTRWDIGFVNPCIELRSKKYDFSISPLNERGSILMDIIYTSLKLHKHISHVLLKNHNIVGKIAIDNNVYEEEHRSKQPSIFSIIRIIKSIFFSEEDKFLGLYGAFGYDLLFQFENIEMQLDRNNNLDDMVLYIPDHLIVIDHRTEKSRELFYEFTVNDKTTKGLPRTGTHNPYASKKQADFISHQKGKYADLVKKALKSFKSGDLFEVVPSHVLQYLCTDMPSQIFSRLKELNPSPYGFIINLGKEFLIGSSPEMYVRVEGDHVETCPISGTVKRGKDAIEDARQVKKLLNSFKDESELTMCTDVDRNDKSRVCIPGSVQVIGRRQCEFYSHLIHTVDHVEGYLRPEYDSLDAFMTHMWAVTITGAPKRAAVKWIEANEDTPRQWYGGAVGYMTFNGDINTGLTLRTIHLDKDGIANVRVGATLLIDSIPEEEEEETYTKAAALIKSIQQTPDKVLKENNCIVKTGKNVLLVDHEDSFVHTLANYFRQAGANVTTVRSPHAQKILSKPPVHYDLVVLSPGPGRPSDFDLEKTIGLALSDNMPVFGVCLGLQGIVEYFGGSLNLLEYPQHGKPSLVTQQKPNKLFHNIADSFQVGRYHSLYAQSIPESLCITALSEDNIVMAVEHKDLPVYAVQFHPESIMSLDDNTGIKIICNILQILK